jgi:hypothetical protein
MKGMELIRVDAWSVSVKKAGDGEVRRCCKTEGASNGVKIVIPFGVRGDSAALRMSDHQMYGVNACEITLRAWGRSVP